MIDIAENKVVLNALNAIINNGGIAEVKNEARKGKENIVVVEIKRTLKTKPKEDK